MLPPPTNTASTSGEGRERIPVPADVLEGELGRQRGAGGLVVRLLVAKGRGRHEAEPPGRAEKVQELGSRVGEIGTAGVAQQEHTHARERSTGARPAPPRLDDAVGGVAYGGGAISRYRSSLMTSPRGDGEVRDGGEDPAGAVLLRDGARHARGRRRGPFRRSGRPGSICWPSPGFPRASARSSTSFPRIRRRSARSRGRRSGR